MTAYQLLGIGILLVIFAVIYTHRIDRKVNRNKETPALSKEVAPENSTASAPNFSQVLKTTQVKDGLKNIDNDLDELIELLKEKEATIKDLKLQIKESQGSSGEYSLKQILENSATSQEIESPEEVQESVEKAPENEHMAKYDRIFKLLEAGLSVEEVARTLNMGYREVELAAKLRQKGA